MLVDMRARGDKCQDARGASEDAQQGLESVVVFWIRKRILPGGWESVSWGLQTGEKMHELRMAFRGN